MIWSVARNETRQSSKGLIGRRRQMGIALMILSISTLSTFVAAELILRQIYPFPQPQFLAVDPIVGHRHRPNIAGYFAREGLGYVRINSHGFRDKEYTVERNDKKRIVVLGDSYTEALQVDLDRTYHGQLEAEFADRLEVLNFGVGGYGTAQELLTYKCFARTFRPDIVLLAFYPGNDLKDNVKALSGNYPRPYFVLGQHGLELDDSFRSSPKQQRPKLVYDLYYSLTDHSIILSLLDQLRYRKSWEQSAQHRELVPAGSKAQSDLIYAPRSQLHREAWLLTERLILELAAEVGKDGAKFVLLVQDSMPRQITTIDNAYYVEGRLGRLCEENGLVCGFMGPAAVDIYRKSGGTLHGFGDGNSGHWNYEGHEVAYAVLRELLIEKGLLP
jgi:hypothetical protein